VYITKYGLVPNNISKEKRVSSYPSNQELTEDCLKIFDRQKKFKYLLKKKSLIISDVEINNGGSLLAKVSFFSL